MVDRIRGAVQRDVGETLKKVGVLLDKGLPNGFGYYIFAIDLAHGDGKGQGGSYVTHETNIVPTALPYVLKGLLAEVDDD